jgi:hypothetical protein
LGVPFNKLFETTEDGSRKFVCVGWVNLWLEVSVGYYCHYHYYCSYYYYYYWYYHQLVP